MNPNKRFVCIGALDEATLPTFSIDRMDAGTVPKSHIGQ